MVTTIKVEDSNITLEVETSQGTQSISWDISIIDGKISLGPTGLLSSELQKIAILAGMGIASETSKIKELGLYWLEQDSETRTSDSKMENTGS
jgi:hypothetical protein